MFAVIEKKYQWYEEDRWSDPSIIVTERVLDVGEKDMLKKYVKEGGWEKIENDDDLLIEKFEKYDDHANKVQRIIVEVGDVFTKEVY